MAEESAASALPQSDAIVVAEEPSAAPIAVIGGTNMFVVGADSVANADSVVVIGDGLHASVPFAVCVAPLDWSKVDMSDESVERLRQGIVEKIHYHSSSNHVSGRLAVRALADFMSDLTQKKNEHDSTLRLAAIQAATAAVAAASEASAPEL